MASGKEDRIIHVLAVDDEEPFRRLLQKELSRKGFTVDTASRGDEALLKLRENAYDVVLLDILMPGIDGLSVMKELGPDPAAPPVIVITGKATVGTAVEAMKSGAYDYLTKPYKLDELEIVIHRAVEVKRLRYRTTVVEQELVRKEEGSEFIGESPALTEVKTLINRVAPTDSTVLITGESGTGKELVANMIWRLSSRGSRPFIPLNCATFTEALMESELFGHVKGAFTGAHQNRYGIVEAADGGTLFLDEIGEIPLSLQAKLLRFLDSGEFRRVGGNRTLKADVRVIAATNKDLDARVRAGTFREDLFYRLKVFALVVPPLRQRKEDVRALTEFFVARYSGRLAKRVTGLDAESLRRLEEHSWPGNVRELENAIERAVILSDSETVRITDLSLPGRSGAHPMQGDTSAMLQEMEATHIRKVLEETGWNQTRASNALGINRKTLYLKMKKYGLGSR